MYTCTYSETNFVQKLILISAACGAHWCCGCAAPRRSGRLLYKGLAVTLLGGALRCRVPTLEGEKRVRVREGTQTGDRLRLRGLGFPRLGGYQRGDQFIVIR